jgi:hypothetical protein
MDAVILLMWACGLGAVLIPVGLWAMRWMSPVRDYFFLLLYGQAVIYLHVAPTLAATTMEPRFQAIYVWIQLAALLLFELPFALLYGRLMQRPTPAGHEGFRLETQSLKGVILGVLAAVYSVWFIWTVVSRGLLFMRIGPEGVLERYEELPVLVWAGYRMFASGGGILAAALLIMALRASGRMTRLALGLAWLVTVGTYGANEFFNNRLQSIVLVLVTAGLLLHYRAHDTRLHRWRIAALGGVALALSLYANKVVGVIRSNFLAYGEVRTEWFNPFYRETVKIEGEDTPLYLRLNGIDLMAQITPRAWQDGFAHGAAWNGTLAPLVLAFVDREKANEIKHTFETDSKVYLLQHYTSITSSDYFSSTLMDAYGNFGLLGIMLVALILGIACATGTRWLLYPGFPAAPLAGIWLIYLILPFEHPLITTFNNALRFAPLLLLFLALNPLRRHGPASARDAQPAHPRPGPLSPATATGPIVP